MKKEIKQDCSLPVQDEKVTPPFSTTLNPAKTETDAEL
jgi:hypothetical protein